MTAYPDHNAVAHRQGGSGKLNKPAPTAPHLRVRERSLWNKWLQPGIVALPFKDVAPIHLEQIKSRMAKKGKAPRSIQYALAVARQVFNDARRHGIFLGDNPVKQVKTPKVSNRRLRFLSHDEADKLLTALKRENREAWEMTLLSLHCGLRAGEIFGLTWGCIDLLNGLIAVKVTKNSCSRHAFMTAAVKQMLEAKTAGEPSVQIYPSAKGGKTREAPGTFERVVAELGLNAGVEDRRDKVVFHTLRHTFASWLVQAGVDLYRVKELMGHSVIAMTERYAHLAPDAGRISVEVIEQAGGKRGQSQAIL